MAGIISDVTTTYQALWKVIQDTKNRISHVRHNESKATLLQVDVKALQVRMKHLQQLYDDHAASLTEAGRENWDFRIRSLEKDLQELKFTWQKLYNRLRQYDVLQPDPSHACFVNCCPCLCHPFVYIRWISSANSIAKVIEECTTETKTKLGQITDLIDKLDELVDNRAFRKTPISSKPISQASAGTPSTIPTSVPAPITTPSIRPSISEHDVTYIVKPGDTLRRIALNECGNPSRYVQIAEANKDVIKNVDIIADGTVITIPHYLLVQKRQSGNTYVVKPGDFLTRIAEKVYGDPAKYEVIFNANRDILDNPDTIFPDMVLTIPPDIQND